VIRLIKTIDAHAGGQTLRLVVEGFPRPRGRTLSQQWEWLRKQGSSLYSALVRAPRGHDDMTAAVLCESASPEVHAGILFMDGEGCPSTCGHGIIAAATIALERALFFTSQPDESGTRLVFETPAGIVRGDARLAVHGETRRVDSVATTNVPAFVHAASCPVRVGSRELRVDIAFGGAFYAIVDTEAAGIPLVPARLSDLRRLGRDICTAANATARPAHPVDASIRDVAGAIFTGPPHDPEAHLRNVTVTSGGLVDVSPNASGTSAVMAILDAMGLLPEGQPFVHEGLSGTLLRGLVAARTEVGDRAALITQVEGSAWITGEHTFFLDDEDPFREGINF
jgi:proline racemase